VTTTATTRPTCLLCNQVLLTASLPLDVAADSATNSVADTQTPNARHAYTRTYQSQAASVLDILALARRWLLKTTVAEASPPPSPIHPVPPLPCFLFPPISSLSLTFLLPFLSLGPPIRGHLPQIWNRKSVKQAPHSVVTGCTAERYCLLNVVVQRPCREFPRLGPLFSTTYGCGAKGRQICPIFGFWPIFLYKTPKTYLPVTSLQPRGYIAEWFRFRHVVVEGPKGCRIFPATSDRGAGDPKLAQIFTYGKWLYRDIMLLHGASDLDQRCPKTRTYSQNHPKPPFLGTFHIQRALRQSHVNGATTLKLYGYRQVWGVWKFSLYYFGNYWSYRKFKLKTHLHVVLKYSLLYKNFPARWRPGCAGHPSVNLGPLISRKLLKLESWI